MRILLVGHTVEDTIKTYGKEIKKPGGLFYSIITGLNLTTTEDELILLTNLEEEFLNKYSRYIKNANKDFISITNSMPKVTLTLYSNKERDEEYENLTGKLNFSEILNSREKIDGIYINMITGYELTPEEIIKLKEKFHAPVYIDIHSLARGIDKNYRRYFRQIPDIGKWLSAVDLLQANQYEIKTILKADNELDIIEFALSHNLNALIKTEGKRGARIYYREKGETASAFVTAIKINATNQVGCGDSFGISFFYSYICNHNLTSSLRFANKTAGLVSTFNSFEEFEKLRNALGKRNN